MTHDTVTADSAWSACREEPSAELIELGRLRSERSLIEAARDYYYHRWLADEESIGRLRLRVKHLEATLARIGRKESERPP
jgi:hypothetical protein